MKTAAASLLVLLAFAHAQEDCDTTAPSEWDEACVLDYLDNVYEVEYRQLLEDATQADWIYNVEINDDNAEASSAEYVKIAEYDKEAWTTYFNEFNTDTFTVIDILTCFNYILNVIPLTFGYRMMISSGVLRS